VAQARVVTAREHEQRDVRDAHCAVRHREGQPEVAERVGDAQRRDEQRGHGPEQHDAYAALVGIDDARQPRVPDP
jgi:hypothetical protein